MIYYLIRVYEEGKEKMIIMNSNEMNSMYLRDVIYAGKLSEVLDIYNEVKRGGKNERLFNRFK